MRAAALLLAVLLAVPALAGCGGEPAPPPPTPRPPRPPLLTGLTEQNANLLRSREVTALRPAYYRLMIDWAKVQPRPDRPPDWELHDDGCMRGQPPCEPYAGVRARLRAIRADQQRYGGFRVVVMIMGAPDWAAAPAGGCEPAGTRPWSRGPSRAALPAYRRLVRSLLALGREEGVDLRYWSAWNEPNHPYFLSPQRARCDADAPSLAAGRYAAIVRALQAELDAAPGDQQLVLGETAAFDGSNSHRTDPVELIRDLPRDVVCASPIWAQHAYVDGPVRSESAASPGRLVDRVLAALDARGCPHRHHLWITETGARPGGCADLAAALRAWAANPRVDAAFQYTFRTDDAYPVGLADPGLTRLEPAYALWRAYGLGSLPTQGSKPRCSGM